MTMIRLNRLHLVALGLAVLLAGCDRGASQRAITNGSENFADITSTGTQVYGYTWDPEAMWFLFAMCGGRPAPCPVDPVNVSGAPANELTLVRGARVTIIDPLNPTAAYPATAATGVDGEWYVPNVPHREDVPFFAVSAVPPPGPSPGPDPGPFPVAPATVYVPTADMKPIVTHTTMCAGQRAALLGNNGILQAVAKFLTAEGTVTSVGDLQNPAKFGGVIVWWQLLPVPANVHVPAFGTKMTASRGRVLHIDWAPPGVLPSTVQSERGYFVNGSAPVSPIGLTVTLLTPTEASAPITFAGVDNVVDAATHRPWQFPPLPPMRAAPGIVMFGELPALNGGGVTPPWVCLPPEP